MAFSTFLSKCIWAFYSHCLQHIDGAKGFKRKCSAPDGRFGVYLHKLIYVLELNNFSAAVIETYLAQMVGWMLIPFSMFLSTRIWAFYSHCLQRVHGATGVQRKCSAPDGRFGVYLHKLICI